MSSNDIRAILAAADIKCEKWVKQHEKNGNYAIPLLCYQARDNDATARCAVGRRLKAEQEFMSADEAEQKKLWGERVKAVMDDRTREGKTFKATTTALGHQENKDGKFLFELAGAIATRCLLCGLDDHDITTCPHYVTAKREFEATKQCAVSNSSTATYRSSYTFREALTPDLTLVVHEAPYPPLPINLYVPKGHGPY